MADTANDSVHANGGKPPHGMDSEKMLKMELASIKRHNGKRDGDDERPTALCLSGGGTRSASFSLGVLQGLAKRGWLDKFSYLSLVSGGGYIGAWLTSWIRREGLREVMDDLAHSTDRGQKEPAPIRSLRDYSSPMTPKRGFGMDSISLIGIFVRNLLIQWTIYIPAFLALTWMVLFNLGLTVKMAGPDERLPNVLSFVGFFLLMAGLAFAFISLPFRRYNQEKSTYSPKWTALLILAGSCLISLGNQLTKKWEPTPLMYWVAVSIIITAVAFAVSMFIRRRHSVLNRKYTPRIYIRYRFFQLLCALLAAIGVAAMNHVAAINIQEIYSQEDNQYLLRILFVVSCVPYMLLTFFLGLALYAIFSRGLRTHPRRTFENESEREWLGSFGGLLLTIALAWAILHAACLLPLWLYSQLQPHNWLPRNSIYYSPGLMGAAITAFGALLAASGYFSKSPIGTKLLSDAGLFNSINKTTASIASGTFFLILIGYLSLVTVLYVSPDYQNTKKLSDVMTAMTCGKYPLLFLVAAAVSIVISCALIFFAGTQQFSLHNLYGNRLIRAYLGSTRCPIGDAGTASVASLRKPNAFTDHDPADDMPLHYRGLAGKRSPLFPVICAALNVKRDPKKEHLRWQDRSACSFTFSRLHCGSDLTGYCDASKIAGGSKNNALTLGRAMTISGAAVAPYMGYHSSTLLSAVLSFFNVRLGWWLPNPRHLKDQPARRSSVWLNNKQILAAAWSDIKRTLAEFFGGVGVDGDSVYLSDGGHFDNLGLYEMIRRRCGRIVLIDATCDPHFKHDDLARSLRLIRVDFNVEIMFPGGLPNAESIDRTGRHYALGIIDYGAGEPKGTLIYIKPGLSKDIPIDVSRYAADTIQGKYAFPHQTTADQIYDEPQFESYRALGLHSIDSIPVLPWIDFALVPTPRHARISSTSVARPDTSTSSSAIEALSKIKDSVLSWSSVPSLLGGAALVTVLAPNRLKDGPTANIFIATPDSSFTSLLYSPTTTKLHLMYDNHNVLLLPLFEEGEGTLSSAPKKIVSTLGTFLKYECTGDLQNQVKIKITGFSSSSDYTPREDSYRKNLELADKRSTEVKHLITSTSDESRPQVAIDIKQEPWLDGTNHPQDFYDSQWKKMQTRNFGDIGTEDNNYDKNAGSLNRRVEVVFDSLGTCTMRQLIDKITSNGIKNNQYPLGNQPEQSASESSHQH